MALPDIHFLQTTRLRLRTPCLRSGHAARTVILKCDRNTEHRQQGPAAAELPPRTFLRWLVVVVLLLRALAAMTLVSLRWIDPSTTAVHMQRRLQAWIHHAPYREHYKFIPLSQISADLQHAVVAAEDTHFYQHHGFDWNEIQIAAKDDLEGERTRGASTITQQLVKNLFFRHGPLDSPQGRGGHTGAGGRIRPRQTAHPRDLP